LLILINKDYNGFKNFNTSLSMSISKTEDVFNLVKSLTKAEKRAFRLYAGRIQDSDTLLYMQLFDIIEKMKVLDETGIRKKITGLGNTQYSNLKRHLHKQILNSLKLLHKEKRPNLFIREQIDFAYVLYGKGLYMQALKVLSKAKKEAYKNHTDFSLLTIIEMEKMIQSRHITRTKTEPIEQLVQEANNCANALFNRVHLSNISVRLHRYYILNGHAKSQKDFNAVEQDFKADLEKVDIKGLGKMEFIYLYQSYVWYYYIQNNFAQCGQYAQKWIDLFKHNQDMPTRDTNLFFRGYHYLLTSLFNLRKTKAFKKGLLELTTFRKNNYKKFNYNTQIISFLYVHTGRLNQHFLEGTYTEGLETVKSTIRRINRYRNHLDPHKILVLYYKIAWMFIAAGKPDKAARYLNEIVFMQRHSLREDLQSYSRLLHLIMHYDCEDFYALPRLVKTYDIYFKKVEERNEVQIKILSLFKALTNAPVLERKAIFQQYYNELSELKTDPYEQRAFIYLAILPWLKAKINRSKVGKLF